MKNNPVLTELPIPIHHGTHQKGNLRRLQRKVVSQPLDTVFGKDQKLKILMIGRKNNSFCDDADTFINHKRSISTQSQSKRMNKTMHCSRRQQSLQMHNNKPQQIKQDELSISIIAVEKLHRTFVNGVLNKRNKSFRIKQRNQNLSYCNPQKEQEDKFIQILVSGRIMGSRITTKNPMNRKIWVQM